MIDLDKFIGIPHHYGKSTWTACDCAGLVTLFYKEFFDYTINDGKPMGTTESSKKQPLRMLRYLLKTMDKVDDIEFGDIIVFKVFGEHHVGVSLDYGKVLTMEVPVVYGVTRSCIYKECQWLPHFVAAFRRR